MKASNRHLFLLPALISVLGLAWTDQLKAQTFTTLHHLSFDSDGAYPQAGLVLSGNTLYGTAGSGGISGVGTIFALTINGTDFTTLHSFSAGGHNSSDYYTNQDGAYPA